MAVGWEVRLGVLVFLLFLQLVAGASDVSVIKMRHSSQQNRYIEKSSGLKSIASRIASQITALLHGTARFLSRPEVCKLVAPPLSIAIGTIIVSIAFSNVGRTNRDTDEDCNTNLDADISGDGVRASIWIQIGVMILISTIGRLHTYDTGVKEVTAGLILTHVSLVIALVVQMRRGTLTSVDAAIGAAILDAQNVALQIPLSAKETLSARWQVLLVIPTQILGLIVIPFIVAGLKRGDFASEGCECFYVFFWSWISHCGDNFSDDDGLSCFYVYYTLRWIMVMRSSCGALHKSGRYHRAEKGLRTKVPLSKVQAAQLSRKQYRKSLATISLSHLLYALYAITSMVAAEITIQDFELQASSSVYSVGQIIAIIIAGSTVIRTSWVFIGIWNEEDTKGFPDLVFTMLRGLSSYLGFPEAGRADAEDDNSVSDMTEGEARPPSGAPSPASSPSLYLKTSRPAERPSQLMRIEAEEGDAEDRISVSDMSEDGEARPPSGASSPPSPTSLAPPSILAEGPARRRPAHRLVEMGPRWRRDAAIAGLAASQIEQHEVATHGESAPALTRPNSLPQQQPQPPPQPPQQPSPQVQQENRPHILLNRPDIFHSPPHPVTPHHMRPHRDTQSYRFTFRNPFRSAGQNARDSDDDDEDDGLSDVSDMTEVV